MWSHPGWNLFVARKQIYVGTWSRPNIPSFAVNSSKPQLNRGDGIIQPEELDFDAVQRLLKEQPGSRTALKRSQQKIDCWCHGWRGCEVKLRFVFSTPCDLLLRKCSWLESTDPSERYASGTGGRSAPDLNVLVRKKLGLISPYPSQSPFNAPPEVPQGDAKQGGGWEDCSLRDDRGANASQLGLSTGGNWAA